MPNAPDRSAATIQAGLYVVAALCVLGAIAHAIWPNRIDDKTAMFLGLAAVVLIIRDVSKVEFPWMKIEKVRQELKQEVQQVDRRVELIEDQGSLPGSAKARARPHSEEAAITDAEWNSDPNKRKFGGVPASNGRVLEATIKPAAGQSSAACEVRLRVRSTDPARPLRGKVTFHLHPTFGRATTYDAPVKQGVAEDVITSWGRFTVGAEADDGATRLELDLNDVEGGTRKFYMQ